MTGKNRWMLLSLLSQQGLCREKTGRFCECLQGVLRMMGRYNLLLLHICCRQFSLTEYGVAKE